MINITASTILPIDLNMTIEGIYLRDSSLISTGYTSNDRNSVSQKTWAFAEQIVNNFRRVTKMQPYELGLCGSEYKLSMLYNCGATKTEDIPAIAWTKSNFIGVSIFNYKQINNPYSPRLFTDSELMTIINHELSHQYITPGNSFIVYVTHQLLKNDTKFWNLLNQFSKYSYLSNTATSDNISNKTSQALNSILNHVYDVICNYWCATNIKLNEPYYNWYGTGLAGIYYNQIPLPDAPKKPKKPHKPKKSQFAYSYSGPGGKGKPSPSGSSYGTSHRRKIYMITCPQPCDDPEPRGSLASMNSNPKEPKPKKKPLRYDSTKYDQAMKEYTEVLKPQYDRMIAEWKVSNQKYQDRIRSQYKPYPMSRKWLSRIHTFKPTPNTWSYDTIYELLLLLNGLSVIANTQPDLMPPIIEFMGSYVPEFKDFWTYMEYFRANPFLFRTNLDEYYRMTVRAVKSYLALALACNAMFNI